MTVDQLREMLRAQPFQKFAIHLTDGRSLPVEQPQFVAITPQGRTIGVANARGTIEIVDLLLVTSLKPRSNGTRHRGRGKQGPE